MDKNTYSEVSTFITGECLSMDTDQVIEYTHDMFTRVFDEDDPGSMGLYYLYDNTGHKDETKGLELLHTAADSGSTEALYNLALYHLRIGSTFTDIPKGISYLRKAVEQNNADAMVTLGKCYSMGYGVERNLQEAFNLFQKAEEQGSLFAPFHLGVCYLIGYGVDKDKKLAEKWLTKAARLKHNDAEEIMRIHGLNVGDIDKTPIETNIKVVSI